MKRKVWTLGASLLAALFASSALHAEAPAAPDLTIQAYVNGAINIGIWQWAEPYQNAVGNDGYFTPSSTKLTGTLTYEVQMKGPNDADFSDVSPSNTQTFDSAQRIFYCWALDTNYVGSATLRVRAKNASGEVSEWAETDPITATVRVTGTLICSAGTDTAAHPAANVADGRIATLVDDWTDGGKNRYTGYLFDRPTRIKGIRYMARLDNTFWYTRPRYRSSVFQVASDATFSDAQTIHTVSDSYIDITRMTEVTFDEPVTCTAIRHYKAADYGEQSAEIEYIPADPPWPVAATVAASDLTNFWPVVTWTMPEGVWSGCALECAAQADGPFTAVEGTAHTPADGATFAYTNTSALVGVPLYYRVTATCRHPEFDGASFTSSTLSFTRARRLDRAWGAETALLDGVSVLPDTNGVMTTSGELDHRLCFDGDASTFVDQYPDVSPMLPVIGLKFDTPAYVAGFGYVCRNSWCHLRIKNARLYAANEYPELADRVSVSGYPTESSQDATLHYKACDTVLGSGASCYFLYGDGEFYGNVAEVMLFGWTDADIEAAGAVTAPKEVTFSRGAGAGLVLAWTRGNAADGYRVERRVRGADAWTEIGETDAATQTFADATVTTAVYEYRVTTLGANGVEAASETFTYRYYAPGKGTGLSGVVMWPYAELSPLPTQRANEAARGPEAIDLAWTADEPLAPGVTEPVAHLAWQGKIVAPFDGAYTFTLDTDAGGAVFIDSSTVLNSWTGGTKSPSGSITLTAGEHSIRVDYRTNEKGVDRKCVLSWSGPVESEIVPATQLIPSETPPSAKLDGFTVQVYGQQGLASFVRSPSKNEYRIRGTRKALKSLSKGLGVTALLKPFEGPFRCQVSLPGHSNGHAGLMFQNADGNYIVCSVRKTDAYNWTNVSRSDPETGAAMDVVATKEIKRNDSNARYDVQMMRSGRDWTFSYRERGTDATDWTEMGTWTDADGEFDNAGYLGIAVWGGPYDDVYTHPVEVEAKDFKAKRTDRLIFTIR